MFLIFLVAVQAAQGIAPRPTSIDPRLMVGVACAVIAAVLLLLYIYRRRLYILYWIAGWTLIATSMFIAPVAYAPVQLGWMAYGTSQFLGIVGALAFVVAADAYRHTPRLRRLYALLLLPVAIWFLLAPAALTPRAVFTPGHLLIAAALASAGVAHLLLLRQVRMLGTVIVAVTLWSLAAVNIWIAVFARQPDAPAVARALLVIVVIDLVAALGMQLMTFEDMTYELRRANRRLETAQDDLRQLVITDPLTGCRNRRFFDEVIGRELRRHARYNTPLSLLFIDIDRFKTINDTLGHETGDRILRDVAGFLRRKIREADYVFRWGGDEFLVLISCIEAEAIRRGVELQAAFEAAPEAAGLPPGVGLSIGCIGVAPGVTEIMTFVQAADTRMYADKKRRR
ncbi:MAG TPA: GGDEF domain-containing protein [Vicinamibacterales bacterium]|nr:GGDEF domain-containing protein [Vicinamibacterales bacterium]